MRTTRQSPRVAGVSIAPLQISRLRLACSDALFRSAAPLAQSSFQPLLSCFRVAAAPPYFVQPPPQHLRTRCPRSHDPGAQADPCGDPWGSLRGINPPFGGFPVPRPPPEATGRGARAEAAAGRSEQPHAKDGRARAARAPFGTEATSATARAAGGRRAEEREPRTPRQPRPPRDGVSGAGAVGQVSPRPCPRKNN